MKIIVSTIAAFFASASIAGACTLAPPNEAAISQKLMEVAKATIEMDDRVMNLIIEPMMEFDTQYITPSLMCPDAIIYSENFAVRYKVNDAFGAISKTVCNGTVKVTFTEDWTETNKHTFAVEGTNNMRCTR